MSTQTGSEAFRRVLAAKRALVVMGRPVIDVQMQVPRIPGPGEKVLTDVVTTTPGGVDGNFAASLASLGVNVTAVGSEGNDQLAEVDRASLRSFGVECRWDQASAGRSTVCYVTVDAEGERAVVVSYPDDEGAVAAGLLRGVTTAATEYWHLCYLGVLRDLHRELLPLLRSSTEVVAATLEHSDWQGAWLGEAADALDVVFVADETFEVHGKVIEKLSAAHGWTLVVTCGAAGSWLAGPHGRADAPAGRLSGPIIDTTGAGDAFASSFCAAWLAGLRGQAVLDAANWYAAQKIQLAGPRSFASAEEFLTALTDADASHDLLTDTPPPISTRKRMD